MLAPSAASRVAMPRPMPDVEPVTSAVLPFNMRFPSVGVRQAAYTFGMQVAAQRGRNALAREAALRQPGARLLRGAFDQLAALRKIVRRNAQRTQRRHGDDLGMVAATLDL